MKFAEAKSQLVAVGDTKLQVVEGGSGDTVMLVSGWPQSALAWEPVFERLTGRYRVLVVEPPALGNSASTAHYDMASIAALFYQLAVKLQLPRFHLVGHDIGCWVAYAYAARHADTLRGVTLIEAAIPGVSASAAYAFTPEQAKKTWHFFFNYLPELPEELVTGRENVILEWIFRHRTAHPQAIPRAAIDEYVRLYSRPGAFTEALGYYRAIFESGAQNREIAATKLKMPVLAVGGALWLGEAIRAAVGPLAENFHALSVPDCAHFPPEEQPEALTAALVKHFARSP